MPYRPSNSPQAPAGQLLAVPQWTPLPLDLRHLQPLLAPEALDALVVDTPAVPGQQGMDVPVAVPRMPVGVIDHLVVGRR